MTQEVHVTSAAITKIQARLLGTTRPFIEELLRELDATEVAPLLGFIPPFSLLGKLYIEPIYDEQRSHSRKLLGEAEGALRAIDNIVAKLDQVKATWRAAEDANTVLYK